MRITNLAVTLSVFGSLFLIGCGGGNSFNGAATGGTGGATSSNGPSLDQTPQLYAEAMCSALAKCSQIAANLLLGANDCPSLISAQIVNATLPGIQSAVTAGTATYDASAANSCKDAIASSGCSFGDNLYVPACEAALGGKVSEGGACAINEECSGDLYCKYSGVCPGTCSALEAEGALCRSNKDCQSGLDCFGTTGITGKCTVKPTLGHECGFDLPGTCASQPSGAAVICWGASASQRGKCVAVDAIASQAIGSNCSLLTGSLCVSGASCQITSILLTGSCVATVASGNSCTFSFPDPCPKGQYCTATGADTPGSCSLLPLEAQPCVTGIIPTYSNKVCADEHICVSGTCTKFRANGTACNSNAICYSGRCDSQSQKCVPNQNCNVAAVTN